MFVYTERRAAGSACFNKSLGPYQETCEQPVFAEPSQGFQKQQSYVKLLLYIQELYEGLQ